MRDDSVVYAGVETKILKKNIYMTQNYRHGFLQTLRSTDKEPELMNTNEQTAVSYE